MNPQNIKPGRRLRKLLYKYGIKKVELENEVMLQMSSSENFGGFKARTIENFKRFGNVELVPAHYIEHNVLLNEVDYLEVTFDTIAIKHGEGKRNGWLNIKITNIKEAE